MTKVTGRLAGRIPKGPNTWACFALGLIVLATIPEPFLPAEVVRLRDVLQRSGLNRADYESMERGYYEGLLDTVRSVSSNSGKSGDRPAAAPKNEHGPTPESPVLGVDDMREYVLEPAIDATAKPPRSSRAITSSASARGLARRGAEVKRGARGQRARWRARFLRAATRAARPP